MLSNVQNLGARGLVTPPLPDHYANILIRRGLAKSYSEKPRKNKLDPEVKKIISPEVKADFSKLKKKELKAKLDELGIEYSVMAKKSALRKLLENASQ